MYEDDQELDAFFRVLFDVKQIRKLGEGAFGLAILAHDESEHIDKVFKLPKHEKTTEALKAEGTNLLKLRNLLHPNIIQLHKYGYVEIEWQGRKEKRYYLCLAFGGTSLRARLGHLRVACDAEGNQSWHGSGTRLPVEEALRIAIDVCQGLEAAHGFKDSEIHIIHRDIKPDNILIDNTTSAARIADFGISRVIDRSTGIVSGAGTLPYMDPECFMGRAGVYSDLYSLGVVLYEMLTGDLPFENFPVRMQHPPRDPRELNPETPDELARIIFKTLENDVSQRYARATDMLADLKRVQATLNPLPERYRRVEQIGPGRLLCEDTQTGQKVAVQLVESEANAGDLAREAALLDKLGVSAILAPTDHFRNEHIVGIVSPPPRGQSLAQRMGDSPARSASQIADTCRLVAKACDIVSAAHRCGVVHGFLSPQLICCRGGEEMTISGFGAAPVFRARRRDGGSAEAFLKSFRDFLPCVSPQLLAGEADPAPTDDVFSIGALFYCLLTGQPHATEETLRRIVRGDAVPKASCSPRELNPAVTRRLASIVAKALAWNAQDRQQSVQEVGDALRECRWPDDTAADLAEEALEAYKDGDVLRAYELLDKAIDVDPGNPQVHFARGAIYLGEKEYKWAIGELQSAESVAPTKDVYVLLGRCLVEWKGQHDKAEEMFERALQYGEDAETRSLLAECLWQQGRQGEAIREMERAVASERDGATREPHERLLATWRSVRVNSDKLPGRPPSHGSTDPRGTL